MQNQSSAFSVISLICGISSLVFICCCFPISIILGILGIVFACICKKENSSNGQSQAGMICSIIGLVFSAIILILFVFLAIYSTTAEFNNYYPEFRGYCYDLFNELNII